MIQLTGIGLMPAIEFSAPGKLSQLNVAAGTIAGLSFSFQVLKYRRIFCIMNGGTRKPVNIFRLAVLRYASVSAKREISLIANITVLMLRKNESRDPWLISHSISTLSNG